MKFPALLQRLVSQRLASSFRHLFLVFFLFAICYLLFATSPISAQTPTPNPYTAPNTNPDVPKNLHTYTQNVIIEIMSAATCQLAGIDPVNPNTQCLGVDQKTGKIGFVENGGGAIGVMSQMISVLYTPPLHTGDYFNHLAQNFGIVKPAYAQGTGFEGLKPLLGIWTAFRNIVYLIFTIVFVVIGLAIMFRIKIDPRTVMTIQNQIPKIVVGIVLVTFSYAIAGFLIDMMYTSIYLTGNVLASTANKSPADITGLIQSENPFSAASQTVGLKDVTWEPAKTVGDFIKPVFDNAPGKILTGIVGGIIGTQVRRFATEIGQEGLKKGKGLLEFLGVLKKVEQAAPPGSPPQFLLKTFDWILGSVVGVSGFFFAKDIFGFFTSLIAFLIIAIAILWSLFRLWFTLIMAYIYILIDVVLAPFWIAGGIIPGQPVTSGGWLRHILSYIAAFPTTIALFLLGKVFIDAFGTDQKGFVPPLIGNPTDTNAIGAIIGLGIILLSSNVVNMTKKLFKAPVVDVGSIGQALGVGVGVPISTIKTGVSGIMASKEWIPGPGGQFRQRKPSEAILGRLFGR